MEPYTVKVVNISDVLDALGIDEGEYLTREAIYDAFDGVSFGDASFTLIFQNRAWGHIQDGLQRAGWSANHPDGWSADLIEHTKVKFFCIVDADTYINLEA